MRYIIPQELKASTKLNKVLYVKDLFFIIIYFAVFMLFKGFVHENLRIIYYVYNALVALILTVQSPYNPKKRVWESIYYFLLKDKSVYKPISIPKGNVLSATKEGEKKYGKK